MPEGRRMHTILTSCKMCIRDSPQRHAAVLGQLHIAVALDVLVELVQQCLLRLGVDLSLIHI